MAIQPPLLRLALACALFGSSAHAGGPYRTPPMGWRSWEAFYSDVNQTAIEAVMDAMADDSRAGVSLRSLGYADVGTDDAWQACGAGVNGSFHDAAGNPLVNLTLFPDLAAMAHKAHTLGLTAGFYMNNCACAENQFADPAMIDRIYARSVAAFVRWGFDSLKVGH
jgi:alpha-galactosidase